jgi:hypothetical protein
VKTYLQYFNVEKMGRFPNGAEALQTRRMGVFTKLPSVKESKGGIIYVIAGLGKPKRYYLWESFTIDDIQQEGDQYTVSGPGWVLAPPPLLQGKEFDKFKAACANFISFRAIDDLPYHKKLGELAGQFHLEKVNAACEDFCGELIKLLPKNGDACYYRGTVRQALGKGDAAKEDFTKAIQLGTNFAQEARAALEGGTKAAAAPKPGASEQLAKQVVAKGVFADKGMKKPAGVPEGVWRAVVQRRGPEEFRQALLKAYGGRCAVTGYDGEPALEAAFLTGADGTGAPEVTNGLLLRGDIRTLFDLNLLRIHPRTKKVFLADGLKKGYYAKLVARRLRLPQKKEEWPSLEALEQRWEASGGGKG